MNCSQPRGTWWWGVVLIAATFSLAASAADWPQFQGPNRNGISPETGLARTWPASGPRVLWTTKVGLGFAGPVVRDGQVYILDRVENARDVLRCLSLDTGKELWRYAYNAPGKISHNGSRTPPTVDDRYVYSVGMMGDFLCIDRKTHKPVWRKNLVKDFGLTEPTWGVAQAPSLYKNLVIVAPQAPNAYVVAYNRVTGKLVWKSPGLGLVGYTTPVVVTLDGTPQVVMIGACNQKLTKLGCVAGLSLTDGSVLWKYTGFQCYIPIPYPTLLPGNRLFITGGYRAGAAMIKVNKGPRGFEVKQLFKVDFKTCGSQIQQPIYYKNYLYVNSNSNERLDGMICLALDGTVKWRTSDTDGLPGFERGNLLLADNMIYNLDGRTGILHLIDPSPKGYKELAKAKVLDGHQMWAPMALSNGKLLVRSQYLMKCLDVKNP